MFGVCGALLVGCCLLFGMYGELRVVGCLVCCVLLFLCLCLLLCDVCCLLFVVWCVVYVAQ